jgi:polysaccharide export outer membrane protein
LRVLLLIGVAGLAGCGSAPPIGSTGVVSMADAAGLPSPSELDQVAETRTSLIGPQDKLIVDVWGVQNLSREVQVDAGGSISMPLAGTLQVAGLNPAQVAEELRSRLLTYVKDPLVTVNVQEALSRTLTVDGAVEEPGNYPVMNNMTLLRAIAAAKGESELSNPAEVVIFRSVNGQRMAALYNVGAIRRGNYADPKVYPNDTIVVGESGRKRLLQYAVQLGPALLTPLVYILNAG